MKEYKNFPIGDVPMIMVHPERFLLGTKAILFARCIGPYMVHWKIGVKTYKLDISQHLLISLVFDSKEFTVFCSSQLSKFCSLLNIIYSNRCTTLSNYPSTTATITM